MSVRSNVLGETPGADPAGEAPDHQRGAGRIGRAHAEGEAPPGRDPRRDGRAVAVQPASARWSSRSRRSCSRCSRGPTASSCSRPATRRPAAEPRCSSARPPRRSWRASGATTTRRASRPCWRSTRSQYVGADVRSAAAPAGHDVRSRRAGVHPEHRRHAPAGRDPRARRDPARQGAPAAGGAVRGGDDPAPRGDDAQEGAAPPVAPPVSSLPVLGAPAAPPPTTAPLASGQLSMMLQTVRTQDYFWALDVERDAPAADIDRAYEALARSFHADRYRLSPEDDRKAAQEIFDKLAEAHRTLRDPGQAQGVRREADAREETPPARKPADAPSAPAPMTPPPPTSAPAAAARRPTPRRARSTRSGLEHLQGAPPPRGGRGAPPGGAPGPERGRLPRRARVGAVPAGAGRRARRAGGGRRAAARPAARRAPPRRRPAPGRDLRADRASPTWRSRSWNACWPSIPAPPKWPKSCTGCERSSAAPLNSVAPRVAQPTATVCQRHPCRGVHEQPRKSDGFSWSRAVFARRCGAVEARRLLDSRDAMKSHTLDRSNYSPLLLARVAVGLAAAGRGRAPRHRQRGPPGGRPGGAGRPGGDPRDGRARGAGRDPPPRGLRARARGAGPGRARRARGSSARSAARPAPDETVLARTLVTEFALGKPVTARRLRGRPRGRARAAVRLGLHRAAARRDPARDLRRARRRLGDPQLVDAAAPGAVDRLPDQRRAGGGARARATPRPRSSACSPARSTARCRAGSSRTSRRSASTRARRTRRRWFTERRSRESRHLTRVLHRPIRGARHDVQREPSGAGARAG